MSNSLTPRSDQRSERTRAAALAAFVELLQQKRYDQLRIADIVAACGIGRSTFYEHFASKDALLLASFDPVLVPLTSAATGRASRAALITMLDHVWASRAQARPLLRAAVADKLSRALAARICGRLDLMHGSHERHRIAACGAAARQLAILKLWVDGGTSASKVQIANALMATALATLPIPVLP